MTADAADQLKTPWIAIASMPEQQILYFKTESRDALAQRSARRAWIECRPTCDARLKAPPLLPTKRRDDARFEGLKCCKGGEPPVYSE